MAIAPSTPSSSPRTSPTPPAPESLERSKARPATPRRANPNFSSPFRLSGTSPTRTAGDGQAALSTGTHSPELAKVFSMLLGPGLSPLGPAIRGNQIRAAEGRETSAEAHELDGVIQGAIAASDARAGTSLLGGPAGSFSFGAEPLRDPLRP